MTFWNVDRIQINLPFFHFLFLTFFPSLENDSLTNHQITKAEDDDSSFNQIRDCQKNSPGQKSVDQLKLN